MHLNEIKSKNPSDLLLYAESLEVENASNLRKQDMMFACLKKLAENDVSIYGEGVLSFSRWFWIFKISGFKLSCRRMTYMFHLVK